MKTRLAVVLLLTVALGACSQAKEAGKQAGMDLPSQLTRAFSEASDALASVTDAPSAEDAVSALESVNSDIDDISAAAENASPEVKASLSDMASSQIPGLKELTEQAFAIPGVKPIIQPPMDAMLSKLAGFM